MKSDMKILFRRTETKILFSLFLILTVWRVVLFSFPQDAEGMDRLLHNWGAAYQVIALVGGIGGVLAARLWGGWKSVMGKAVMAFAVGLLLQTFGQSVYSYFNLVAHVEVPYPSVGDIGFFGSIPFYIYGAVKLARTVGAAVSLRSWVNQMQAILLPIIMLGLSYYFFLRGYEFDWSNPIKVFLDFGYPFGQAIYVACAILTYTLSRRLLGGLMRIPTLMILVSLIIQYAADYTFLYQSTQGTWSVGGVNDYMYLIAYLSMSLSLVYISAALQKLRNR